MTNATASPSAVPPVAPGEVFAGKYLIEREIGAGGMGVVMAARHHQLGQTVAIKLLAVPREMDRNAARRFLAEAQAAARLRSEHVARVMDADIDEKGRHYIVMEYLQGADLGRMLAQTGPLPVLDAVGYLLQACEGIAEAHANRIIHRDLKPENLFVTRRIDGSPLVKVLDFGISKMMATESRPHFAVTPRGALVGSPLYMSPEQFRVPSTIDARSDIWSLGVILYELLAGRNPFAAADLHTLVASVLTGEPVPLATVRPEVPAELAAIVATALEKDPARRLANVGELALALAPWAPAWASDSAARATRTLGVAPRSAAPERGKRRRARWVLGAAAAIAVVVGAVGLMGGGRGPAPVSPTNPSPPAAGKVEPSPPRSPSQPTIEVPATPPAATPPPPVAASKVVPHRAVPAGARSAKIKPKRASSAQRDPLEGRK